MRKIRTATLGFRLIATLVVLLTGWFGAAVTAPNAAAAEKSPLIYIALGDSYAAGYQLAEHAGSCDRSPKAYPFRVKDGLNATFRVDFPDSHHLACSGATAGANPKSTPQDLSISHQFESANAILAQRDGRGDKSPVLITITIGANDLGLADPNTLRQVVRPLTILQPTVVASGGIGILPGEPSISLGPPQSGEDFFKWLDKKTAPIAPSLTTGIDSLLSHENVHIVLTDYPNPFRKGGFGACNDFFVSLSCEEAMQYLLSRLNQIVGDQALRIHDKSRLWVAPLGARFAAHYSDCAPFVASENAIDTWFLPPTSMTDAIANMAECFHPNERGAQGIADAIVPVALRMLPAPAATGDGSIAVENGSQSSSSGTSAPGVAVEVILDTSGSMNDSDQGGQTRLEVAKDVATRLVTDTLPPGVPMALRTYSGCSTSLAIPMQPLDPASATSTIAGLKADGSTPIEKSLRAAAADLAGVPGPKIIVLVTDGLETCNGDPRAAITDIVAQNITVQVNIVGFAIDNSGMTRTFQDWAAAGHGRYYEASDKIELDQAVTSASQLPFHVLDQQNAVVADGVVGGDRVSVPAGTYTVEIDTNPVTRQENVVVTTGKTTAVDLNPGGTSSDVPPSSLGSSNSDLMSLLPVEADIPDGLVPLDSQSRTLDQVVANYAHPDLARQNFMAWGWKGNATCSFTLPSGQSAQSGVLNEVYVSIHEFDSPESAKAALDFSLTEQQTGQPLDEVDVGQFGNYTRGLYGLLDYGYETTILVQQGNLLIRVSAAELDRDPTAKTQAITSAILAKFQNGVASTGTSSTAGSTETWTASVLVALCDAPPNSDRDMNCHGEAGVVITIALASGEVLGSCTSGEPVQFPGGDMISLCSVDGLPFNADLVASQDPLTIPPGYEPFSNSLSLHVDNLIPGGGDQATFTFFDVRTDAGSTDAASTSRSNGSEAATLLMTFRGCPEGFDPATGDLHAECTIPLDAPDAAIISWGGDGQGGMSITQLHRRDNDGAYIYTGSAGTMSVQLSGLAPVVRNGYQVFGADGGEGGTYAIKLVNGETREIDIFYYYQ